MGRAQGAKQPGRWTQVMGPGRGEVGQTKPATLIVSGTSSKCGVCGKGADPHEERHITVLGWGGQEKNGCGVRWTHITTSYIGGGIEDATKEMRPDLIFVPVL